MPGLRSQMQLRDREMVPRILVQGMFAVMLSSLALVSFATLTDRPKVGVVREAPVVREVTVTMTAARDGSVTVTDPEGEVVARSGDDRNGFIGVMWRVMARERLRHGLPDAAPVRVVRRENGHTAVIDPETGMSVELIGYGQDNVAAFARLVD